MAKTTNNATINKNSKTSNWDKYLENKEFRKCFNETYLKSYKFRMAYNGKVCRTEATMEYVCRTVWKTALKSYIGKNAIHAFLNYLVNKGVFGRTGYQEYRLPRIYTLYYVKK